MTKKHVFISYVREDRPYVEALAVALAKSGENVWFDKSRQSGIAAGGEWKREIRDAIDASYAFLFCSSENLIKRSRTGVYPEAKLAVRQYKQLLPGSKYIFPIRFDDSALPRVEIDEQQYLDEIQATDLFGTRQERTANFASLVRGIRESPLRPAGKATPAPPPVTGIPGQLEYILAELCGIFLEKRNLLKAGLFAIGIFVAILVLGPLIQAPIDLMGAKADLKGVGTKVAVLGWFISLLAVLVWPRKADEETRIEIPKGSQKAGTDSLADRWQKTAHRVYGEKLREQTRQAVTFSILWGSVLTTAWWFVCAFGTPLVTSGFLNPKQGDPWPYFVVDSFLALIGLFILIRVIVGRFSAKHMHSLKDRLAIAFGIAVVPGILGFLLLTPQALTVLCDQQHFPMPRDNFQTNYVVFQFMQRLVAIPVALTASMIVRPKPSVMQRR